MWLAKTARILDDLECEYGYLNESTRTDVITPLISDYRRLIQATCGKSFLVQLFNKTRILDLGCGTNIHAIIRAAAAANKTPFLKGELPRYFEPWGPRIGKVMGADVTGIDCFASYCPEPLTELRLLTLERIYKNLPPRRLDTTTYYEKVKATEEFLKKISREETPKGWHFVRSDLEDPSWQTALEGNYDCIQMSGLLKIDGEECLVSPILRGKPKPKSENPKSPLGNPRAFIEGLKPLLRPEGKIMINGDFWVGVS